MPTRFPRLQKYPRNGLTPLWMLKVGAKFEVILDATTSFPYKRVYGRVVDISVGSVLVETERREHWSRETLVVEIQPPRFPRLK